MTTLRCGHFWCASCLKTLVETQLAEGSVHLLKCPDPSCKEDLPPDVIKVRLGEGERGVPVMEHT